ncbi:MAG: RNA polymerase sigma factor [Solirubrobacteraceae bacterium]
MRRMPSITGAHVLDPDGLVDHIDVLFRVAWAICGSRHDAEDLVQETFVKILKRPRLVRGDSDAGYLIRALKNTHASWYRGTARQRSERFLLEEDGLEPAGNNVSSRELMEAIASAPEPYRDAVIAVDLVGLSYRKAARSLRTTEGTLTSRLHRGRQHVARLLTEEMAGC